jgi:hypothetical protein
MRMTSMGTTGTIIHMTTGIRIQTVMCTRMIITAMPMRTIMVTRTITPTRAVMVRASNRREHNLRCGHIDEDRRLNRNTKFPQYYRDK